MIYVRLFGGTGNQLFQIAFSLKLQKIYQQEICFDVSKGTEYATPNGDLQMQTILAKLFFLNDGIHVFYDKESFNREAGLKMFLADYLSLMPRMLRKVTKSNKLFVVSSKWIQKHFNKRGLYTAFDCFCEPVFEKKNFDIYVNGLFTCREYFDDIRNIIEDAFCSLKIDENHAKYVEDITTSNSVCVHVRKGTSYTNNKYLNVCTQDYYMKAMEHYKRIIKNPVFYIFSNDYEWCKNNLNMDKYQCVIVNSNNDMDVLHDIQLMRLCKFYILSNSTLGWWGQYLNSFSNKRVISPSVWSKGTVRLLSDLIEESWELI